MGTKNRENIFHLTTQDLEKYSGTAGIQELASSEQARRVTDTRRERRWEMVGLQDRQQQETEGKLQFHSHINWRWWNTCSHFWKWTWRLVCRGFTIHCSVPRMNENLPAYQQKFCKKKKKMGTSVLSPREVVVTLVTNPGPLVHARPWARHRNSRDTKDTVG